MKSGGKKVAVRKKYVGGEGKGNYVIWRKEITVE